MIQNKLNKLLIFILPLFLAVFFAACSSGDKTNEEWQKDNDAIYEKIKNTSGWEALEANHMLYGGPEGVYIKVIEKGTETESPFQTAQVKVNYMGYFLDDKNQTFDKGGMNVIFGVDKVVRGFGAALQQMHVGDKWEICIPYYLGYGTSAYSTIRGYSTLFFEVTLVEIIQYP